MLYVASARNALKLLYDVVTFFIQFQENDESRYHFEGEIYWFLYEFFIELLNWIFRI